MMRSSYGHRDRDGADGGSRRPGGRPAGGRGGPRRPADFCQLFCSIEYEGEYPEILAAVREVLGSDARVIGCSTASALTERGVGGGVACGLIAGNTVKFATGLGTGLADNVSGAIQEVVADLPAPGRPYLSAITLYDGLSGVGEELALVARQRLGPEVTVVGGAAADDHALESTYVFGEGRVAEDAVAVALIGSEGRPAVSVRHGHEPFSEPVEVTRADGSVVTNSTASRRFRSGRTRSASRFARRSASRLTIWSRATGCWDGSCASSSSSSIRASATKCAGRGSKAATVNFTSRSTSPRGRCSG